MFMRVRKCMFMCACSSVSLVHGVIHVDSFNMVIVSAAAAADTADVFVTRQVIQHSSAWQSYCPSYSLKNPTEAQQLHMRSEERGEFSMCHTWRRTDTLCTFRAQD